MLYYFSLFIESGIHLNLVYSFQCLFAAKSCREVHTKPIESLQGAVSYSHSLTASPVAKSPSPKLAGVACSVQTDISIDPRYI